MLLLLTSNLGVLEFSWGIGDRTQSLISADVVMKFCQTFHLGPEGLFTPANWIGLNWIVPPPQSHSIQSNPSSVS
jgi:hypothetical protein